MPMLHFEYLGGSHTDPGQQLRDGTDKCYFRRRYSSIARNRITFYVSRMFGIYLVTPSSRLPIRGRALSKHQPLRNAVQSEQ